MSEDLLYRYCRERGIAHRQLGKLIIATSESEVDVLRAYCNSAEANGAGALEWKSVEEVSALEPAISCVAAVHAPQTGIVDSHAPMLSLLGDVESAGGRRQVVYRAEVLVAAAASGGGFDIVSAAARRSPWGGGTRQSDGNRIAGAYRFVGHRRVCA